MFTHNKAWNGKGRWDEFALEKFFEKNKNNACIFSKGVILYGSCRETVQNIRVWRSLVSRLNGVQEASSSNLDTRTKTEDHLIFGLFI